MQVILNGAVNGFAISFLALAFALVYLPTGIFFVAVAGIFAICPYLLKTLLQIGLSLSFAILGTLLAGGAMSLLCEILCHEPLSRQRASKELHLIASLGIFMFLSQLAATVWGEKVQNLSISADTFVILDGLVVSVSQEVIIISYSIFMPFFLFFLYTSKIGLLMRGLPGSSVEAVALGFDLRRVRRVAFLISGFFCAVGSILLAYDRGFSPFQSLNVFILAVVATIIGGNTFRGLLLGAFLVAIIRAEAAWNFALVWQDIITYTLLVIVMFVRQKGRVRSGERIEENV